MSSAHLSIAPLTPLASSTRGLTMDEHNRDRSEFEARIERTVGARITHFHFSADYENRYGDIECMSATGRDYAEAMDNAVSSALGTSLTLLSVDPKWSIAFFSDGRYMDRHQIERLLSGEGA